MKRLHDYSLVALLMSKGHSVTANGDGSYAANMTLEIFLTEEREYRLRWKPVLDTIKNIKRDISRLRPRQ